MPLRVLIVAPWGERLGGAEEMLWLWLSHLDRAQVEASIVFLGAGPFAEEVAALGFPAAVVPAGRLRDPLATGRAVGSLARRLRHSRPDVLLNWSAKAQIYGAMAASGIGMGRVVWWQHQIPDGHWIDRLATLLPARAIGCSSRSGQEAQRQLAPRRPSFVVNPGIAMASAPGPDGALRERLGIPADRAVVGMVGRLQPWKGQDRLLTALASLRRRGHDVHGLLVGGDAYELSPGYAAGLKRQVADLELAECVTMTGQVPNARPYFSLMDVAVNASEAEPFGIVLLEAMAAGVAVVAVGNGGPLDIVAPGETGVLAESGEPAALACAIEDLLVDRRRRGAIAAAGRTHVAERFTAERMAESLHGALRGVIGDG